jgi:HD superfamily phosphohydrolase
MFKFDNRVKNKTIALKSDGTLDEKGAVKEYVKYVKTESTKGKIPLIVVGAGISSSGVAISGEKSIKSEKGLPTLIKMIDEINKIINKKRRNDGYEELKSLQEMFPQFNDANELASKIDRAWISKVFTALSMSESSVMKEVWQDFCNWFLFECITEANDGKKYGALSSQTSEAARMIKDFSKQLGGLCFSANFDNYLTFQMTKQDGPGSGDARRFRFGISIFSKRVAENYFTRTRRKGMRNDKEIAFDDDTDNDCVLHANGDVFWLTCSGDNVDGYCPKTGKYFPAYSWRKEAYTSISDMKCDICNSSLRATMTMPGTYKKDHDTREILSTIWKYAASKISTVITIGLSCNWDDVLLKFIIGLMFENNIPHFDINNGSEEGIRQIEIHKKIVNDSNFHSMSLRCDAHKGVEFLNNILKDLDESKPLPKSDVFDDAKKKEICDLVGKLDIIKRLKDVSQIGLKSYWMASDQENDRWKHSVSVAENALEFYRRLHKNSHKDTNPSEEVLVYMSGLFHDCGHLPFSHLLEDVFSELSWKLEKEEKSFSHTHYSSYLLRQLFTDGSDTSSIGSQEVIRELKEFAKSYNIDCEDIIKVIDGNYGVGYIDALINSELDCDKIAYIFTDSSQTNTKIMLNEEEFKKKLYANAFITQEGLIVLDSESAWMAFRLLDERKRMYDELYYANEIRCLESVVKFIVITYFVQKYNKDDLEAYKKYNNIDYGDLSHCRIMMTIDDLFEIIKTNGNPTPNEDANLRKSLRAEMANTLARCTEISLATYREIRARTDREPGQLPVPKEIGILKTMYQRLTGLEPPDENVLDSDFNPARFHYADKDILDLSKQLTYRQLMKVRKRIHLNFPGVLLIDVYEAVKYFSSAKSRRKRLRIDGTNEPQIIYLVPAGERNTWHNEKSLASINIADYKVASETDGSGYKFNVYKLSDDNTLVEHAVNILKKEMKAMIEVDKEEDDE